MMSFDLTLLQVAMQKSFVSVIKGYLRAVFAITTGQPAGKDQREKNRSYSFASPLGPVLGTVELSCRSN
jgi:hypothetical protein